jgi:DNA-directed RNA polymerase subunit H
MVDFVVGEHFLVPEHVKLSEQEKQDVLVQFNATLRQFPVILDSDPAVVHLQAQPGDMILVKRRSSLVGVAPFYRVVIHG